MLVQKHPGSQTDLLLPEDTISSFPKSSYISACLFSVDLQCCTNYCYTAKWFSYIHKHILLKTVFHYHLSQDVEYSFLCYTVGPCCLSILYIIVSICYPKLPIHSYPVATTSLFSKSAKTDFCFIDKFICQILDSTYSMLSHDICLSLIYFT